MGATNNELVQKRVRAIMDRLSRARIVILVWGPGRDDANYAKRIDIRHELQRKFPLAEIHFSEDDALRDITRDILPTVTDEELIHAKAAHLIFALDTSKGVGEEIAKYSEYPTIARKMVVLSHERYRGASTFPAEVRRPLAVEWYSDADFRTCDLAKVKCCRHVTALLLKRAKERGEF